MPKSFLEVQDEYNEWQQLHGANPEVAKTTLPDYAKFADEHDATPGERAEGYSDAWYKKANAVVDRGFRATHIPQVTGQALGGLAGLVDSSAGTHIEPTVTKLGEDLPRSLVESLLTIPTGPAGEAAVWLPRIRKLAQVAGYGGTGLQGYATTESPVGAAIGAVSMYGMNKLLLPETLGGADVGGMAADAIRKRLGVTQAVDAAGGSDLSAAAPELTRSSPLRANILPGAGATVAEASTVGGLNEATRQAQMSVGPRAVSYNDPARNPFTEENIAGQVINALPFAGQALLGLHNASGFDPKAVQGMHDWIENRKAAVEADATGVGEGGPSAQEVQNETGKSPEVAPQGEFDLESELKAVTPKFTPTEHKTLIASIRAQLDTAKMARGEGATMDADALYGKAKSLLDDAGAVEADIPMVQRAASEVDAEARQMAPQDPKGLLEFTQKVNGLIDFYNENRAKVEEGEMAPSEIGTQKQSYHPNARDPSVVQRLQDKGLLPKIDVNWLRDAWQYTYEDTNDTKFATDVMAQKVANHLLDNLPEALRQESVAPTQVQSQLSPNVEKVNSKEAQFFDAIAQFDGKTQEYLIEQTLKFRRSPDVFINGRQMNPLDSWQRAVITASQTYDPVARTIQIYKNGKLQKTTINELWSKDYKPIATPVKEGAGGKGKVTMGGKTLPEGNLESLMTPENAGHVEDEEALKADLAQSGGEGMSGMRQLGAEPASAEEALTKGVTQPVEEMLPAEMSQAAKDKFLPQAEQYRKTVVALSPSQAWTLTRGLFTKSSGSNTFREPNMKTALQAVAENAMTKQGDKIGPAGQALVDAYKAAGYAVDPKWTDKRTLGVVLNSFFPSHVPFDAATKMSTLSSGRQAVADRAANMMQWVKGVTERVLDPKAVEAAKRMEGPRAMDSDTSPADFIGYSAPTRLRKWLETPSMGYSPNSEGELNTRQVRPLLQKLGVTKDEMAIYDAAGLDGFLSRGRVPVGELVKWMDEKTPKVEVKKLQPGNGVDQVAGLEHQLETRGFTPIYDDNGKVINYQTREGKQLQLSQLPEDVKIIARQHQDFLEGSLGSDSDAATGRYGVEPKELKDMPGAVDILVRIPQSKATYTDPQGVQRPKPESWLYAGPHFGESDKNVLASVRGYMETLPSGEKVFHVFEVQSDWGQSVTKNLRKGEVDETAPQGWGSTGATKDHPLLAVYEQLALKAAIDHARSQGATKIALSDAETAMMTEGHDRVDRTPTGFGGIGRNEVPKISQEPGMRAAYDVRLPNVMEKLTGDRGVPVTFSDHKSATYNPRPGSPYSQTERVGSPIFKNKAGAAKSDVTARLYDLARTEPKWSAFGYSRPMEGESTGSGQEDLLVNHPKAGQFVPDVYRTIKDAVYKKLGEKGYAGTYRDLAVEMAVSIARQVADLDKTDFYRIAQGPRGLAWNEGQGVGERGQVGLNVDLPIAETNPTKWVHDVMNTLSHEMAHVDDYIAMGMLPKPDAFSMERGRQIQNLKSLLGTLTPEDTHAMIATLEAGLRPKQFETIGAEKKTGLAYGSSDPTEGYATIQSLITQSLLFGKESGIRHAMDVLDYSPTEIQEFAQGQYRHIRDVMDALKETLADEAYRGAVPLKDNTNRYVLSEAFDAVVQGARYASKVRDGSKEVAAARQMIETLSGSISPGATNAMWFKRQDDTSKYVPAVPRANSLAMANATEAISQAVDAVGIKYGKDQQLSGFTKWFYPFSNKMDLWRRKGVDVAGPLSDLVTNTESAIYRTRSDILRSWLKKNPDGTTDWNTENPFIGAAGKDRRLHDAFNEVSQWQRENQGTVKIGEEVFPSMEPMFVQDAQGVIVPNPNHQKNAVAAWAEMSKNMSLDTQQKVMAGSVAADQTHQIMAARTSGFMNESATIRVARMLQAFDKTLPSDAAYQQAHAIYDAFSTGQTQGLQMPPEQLQAVASFLSAVVPNIKRFDALSQARPGFRTESLPGDFIVMYKNKDGEVKFTSAPDEHRARYVMRKVEAQGNELIGENPKNRNELRGKFQDFDAPEAVVERAAFLENEAWKTAVDAIRAKQGDVVADELMRAYTPMTASLKDVTSQGFRKFLEANQSKVDPENLDYLDAMFARAGRLSASGVYHVNSAMKDLLLNDPRARMMPSLGEVINEQWQHITSPTDMTTRRLKGLTAGYYMGASLGNALMELTQGVSMFAPRIVATNKEGGLPKAYGQLFTAVGQTTDMALSDKWQRVAAQAERKDPSTLEPDETRALMMKRATENGVIGHNIVGEIFSSRDLQVQQKKNFGEGDYGPRSMTDLVSNGLYVASQVMTGLYSWAARANDRIAFTMGVNQGIEQGLSGDALYNHARNFHQLVQGGGKADAPGLVTKFAGADPKIRSAVGLVYTLQHYGTKMVSTYAQLGTEAIDSSRTLSPVQRVQARKAFLGFLATQTAIAGALGMPFAGAALTILEDQFGVPVKEKVREVLASLGSGDPDSPFSGSAVADVALNGAVSHFSGMDVSSRLGVSNVFGTSAYRGFNLSDMFGPAPSVLTNMVKSLNYFGQGEPAQAGKALVPQAFKNIVGMADTHAKYGDYALRDSGDGLQYTPSTGQSIGYALGFRPQEYSQRQQAQGILTAANRRQETQLSRQEGDLAARLLQGDPTGAQQFAQEAHYHDPTVRIDDVLRAIMEKAVEASTQRDLLASGPKGNAPEREALMKTFSPQVAGRQSEVGLNQLRTQLAAQLGAPSLMPDGDSWGRAAIVDGMVQKSGGTMPRSQAGALVRMMGL